MSAGMHNYPAIFLDKVVYSLVMYFVLTVFSGIWECVRGSTHRLSGEAVNISLTSSVTHTFAAHPLKIQVHRNPDHGLETKLWDWMGVGAFYPILGVDELLSNI